MSKRESHFFVALLILVLLGLMAACSMLWDRHKMEQANSTSELLSDYRALSDFARQQGLELPQVLKKARRLGVSAIAVDEINRDDLQSNGWARCVNSYELADLQFQGRVSNHFTPDAACVYFVAESADIAQQIASYACESLGEGRGAVVDAENHVAAVRADMRQVGVMGFGIPTATVQSLVKDYGFKVWVRPWNSPFFKPDNLRHIFDNLAMPGVEGVIFGGLRNEVLGFPHYLDLTSELLQQKNLKLGVIELPKLTQQKGIQTLARLNPHGVVRVMSVSSAHQNKLHPQAVASMYSLGARERNIRLLYARPYADSFDKLSAQEASDMMFTCIAEDLQAHLGREATVFPEQLPMNKGFGTPNFCLLLIALAVAAALCWMVRTVAALPTRLYAAVVLVMAGITIASVITGFGLSYWRLVLGLLSLMVFPVWGLLLLYPVFEKYTESDSLFATIFAGWKALLIASGFSLTGGLLGAACLPQVVYMLSIDVFRGVKLHSLMVPALAILGWIVFQHRQGAFKRLRQILTSEVRIWHLLVFVLLLGLGAFYLVRTGNAGGDLVVSDSERELRRWLDMVLGVRPRFKEFMLGNPLLLCLPTLVMCRWRPLVPFAVLGAALGEASLAGTYAHLHTPIFISLQRSGLGVLAGGCGGMLLSALIFLLHRAWLRYGVKLCPDESA